MWPSAFTRFVYGRFRGGLWSWWIRRHWSEVARGCGLTRGDYVAGQSRQHRWVEQIPRLRRVRVGWPRATATVRLLIGQTVADYERAADALRTAVGATQVR